MTVIDGYIPDTTAYDPLYVQYKDILSYFWSLR